MVKLNNSKILTGTVYKESELMTYEDFADYMMVGIKPYGTMSATVFTIMWWHFVPIYRDD